MPYDAPLAIDELKYWFNLSVNKRDEIIEKVKGGAQLAARYSSFADAGPDWCAITLNGQIVHETRGY